VAAWGLSHVEDIGPLALELTLALGLAIGLMMGFTGAGGGVLAVPALVFGLGLSMAQSAPIAMVGVSLAASVGAFEGLRRGVVRYRAAMFIALIGWPFSAFGVALAHRLPDLSLRIVFVLVLAFVAWRQLRPTSRSASVEAEAPQHTPRDGTVAELDPATGRFIWNRRAATGFAGIGAVTGFMSGLLGVSGGFVLVPMLSALTKLNAPSLVGTSLMVGALVTGFGACAAAWQGVPIRWSVAVWFALALIVGLIAARLVSRRMSERFLRSIFVALVIGVACAMAFDVVRRLLGD
jgi:uncharacterized membrane protein YfcA